MFPDHLWPMLGLFHACLAGAEAIVWRVVRLRDDRVAAFTAWATVAALAVPIPFFLATMDGMRMLLLWAHALFLHAPALALWIAARTDGAVRIAYLGLAAILVAIAIDAFVVEPRSLEVNVHTVRHPDVTEPVRIVVLADLQTEHLDAPLRQALETAATLEPDLILFPGDYTQGATEAADRTATAGLNAMLQEVDLQPRLGAFAVQGNTEQHRDWEDAFQGTAIVPTQRTTHHRVGGLTVSALSFHDGFDTRLQLPAEPGLHIAFAHGPDFALGAIGADILIAGHTHGGQVQLPWIGPLITFSEIPRAWASGLTAIGPDQWLLVSRGVGMERMDAPRLRFRCRPEVVVLDLLPVD